MLTWRFVICLGLGLSLGCSGKDNGNTADSGSTLVEGDEAGECSDEADNDRNGLFDCDDPGCEGSPACEDGDDLDADGGSTDDGAETGDTDAGGTTDGATNGGSSGTDGSPTTGGESGATSGAASDDGGSGTPTTAGGDGPADEGPPSCSGPEDCSEDDCPPDSASCTCAEAEDGDGFCVPGCVEDADCAGSDSICLPTGICGAAGGVDAGTTDTAPEDSSCSTDEDCAETCPSGDSCICMEPTSGGEGFCIAACTSDTDCPDDLTCDLDSGRCGGADGGADGGASDGGGDVGPTGGDLDPITDGGPLDGEPLDIASCSSSADCTEDDCPSGSVACICMLEGGEGFCAPSCSTEDDCPADMDCDVSLSICTPDTGGGPSGGATGTGSPTGGGDPGIGTGGGAGGELVERTPCDSDADCSASDCPSDSAYCVCNDFDNTCQPGCTVASDCPEGLSFCDAEGICMPEAADGGGGGGIGGGVEGGGGPGGPGDGEGPSPCAGDADCTADDCPEGVAACICADFGGGGSCVPGCAADSECPTDLPYCEAGVCSTTPGGGESEAPSCVSETGCAPTDCPEWATDCVCHPFGSVCVPTCSTDIECGGTTCDTSTGTCSAPS